MLDLHYVPHHLPDSMWCCKYSFIILTWPDVSRCILQVSKESPRRLLPDWFGSCTTWYECVAVCDYVAMSLTACYLGKADPFSHDSIVIRHRMVIWREAIRRPQPLVATRSVYVACCIIPLMCMCLCMCMIHRYKKYIHEHIYIYVYLYG